MVHVGEVSYSYRTQIGFRDHGLTTNGRLWSASLDLKQCRNRNIYFVTPPLRAITPSDLDDICPSVCISSKRAKRATAAGYEYEDCFHFDMTVPVPPYPAQLSLNKLEKA